VAALDVTAPVARITPKRLQGRRDNCRTVRAPRRLATLTGTVTDAETVIGIANVEFSATTRQGSRCARSGAPGFARVSCRAKPRYVPAAVTPPAHGPCVCSVSRSHDPCQRSRPRRRRQPAGDAGQSHPAPHGLSFRGQLP